MHFTDEAIRMLARQIYGHESAGSDRAGLEAALLPMIRVALRTGHGQPVLVRWVRRHLAEVAPGSEGGAAVDLDWAAPRMARLLCERLAEHVWNTGRETVLGS